MERAIVARDTHKRRFGGGWFAGLATAALVMFLAGCGPEGAGTVKVGNPADVRGQLEAGSAASNRRLSAKQVKALENEEAAKKKTPKLY
jgi:hypothetical protein